MAQELQGERINYRGRKYRVQEAKGWKYIIVVEDGKRKRIGLSKLKKEVATDPEFEYYFGYGWQEWN